MSDPIPGERGASAPCSSESPPALSAQQGADAPRSPARPRRVAIIIGLALAIAGFALWYFVLRGPANDLERFQGDWGVTTSGREAAVAIRVSDDHWEYVGGRTYRVTLNETANPKEIDLDPIDDAKFAGPRPKLYGIYEIDGKVARVRLNDTTQPRPTTFDEPDAIVLELKKVKLEPKGEPGK